MFEGKVKNEGKISEYKSMAEQFICNCAQKGYNNVKKTPGGLLWFLPWDNLQYTTTASFVIATYANYLEAAQTSVQCSNDGVLQASDLLDLARAQVSQAFRFFFVFLFSLMKLSFENPILKIYTKKEDHHFKCS